MKLPDEIHISLSAELVIRFVTRINKPGPISVRGISEMADNIRMQVEATADEDTETREVTITVEGEEPTVLTYPIGAPESFVVAQGKNFNVSLVDIDDSGNRSEATTGDFVANDTQAPTAPGALGIKSLGEE